MRVALVLVVLAGCAGHGDREPAWPKRADAETDGGESLAPRTTSVIAATETDDDVKPDVKAVDKPADAKPAEAKPAEAKATTTTAPDDVIIIDDIVIEIED